MQVIIQNMPQTSNSLSLPTKSMVDRGNQNPAPLHTPLLSITSCCAPSMPLCTPLLILHLCVPSLICAPNHPSAPLCTTMQFSLHISLPSMSSLMAPLCPSLPLWVHPYPISVSPCISMPHMCPLCTPSSPMCPLYPLSIFLYPLHTLSATLCALLYLFMPYLHPLCSPAPPVWPSMSLHSLHPSLCLSVPFCAPSFPLTSLCPLCTLLGFPLHPFMPCLHLSMSPP